MHALFGPVPSKRLGRSLGIDPVKSKVCNYNCVYCQLGRTKRRTLARREYVRTARVANELNEWLASHSEHEIDWITLVGAGEPCLNSEIGAIIETVRACTSRPIAVITNGSLLTQQTVRNALRKVDAVLPSLDAGTASVYYRVNRPHPNTHYEEVVEGLKTFRQEFAGKLAIEVMLIENVNDSDADLAALNTQLRTIGPDEIHINIPTRPPAETWVNAPNVDRLLQAARILGNRARVLPFEIGLIGLSQYASPEEALRDILPRHPMSTAQIVLGMNARWGERDILNTLTAMEGVGEIQHNYSRDGEFWVAGKGAFPPRRQQAT